MGEPLSLDRVFNFSMDEPEPHLAYDFFALGPLPDYVGDPYNMNGLIESDVPLLGEMCEPLGADMVAPTMGMEGDLAMLFGDDDFNDYSLNDDEDDEDFWEDKVEEENGVRSSDDGVENESEKDDVDESKENEDAIEKINETEHVSEETQENDENEKSETEATQENDGKDNEKSESEDNHNEDEHVKEVDNVNKNENKSNGNARKQLWVVETVIHCRTSRDVIVQDLLRDVLSIGRVIDGFIHDF
nr:hypothetical protein [Tanacetum cinerariifolium]